MTTLTFLNKGFGPVTREYSVQIQNSSIRGDKWPWKYFPHISIFKFLISLAVKFRFFCHTNCAQNYFKIQIRRWIWNYSKNHKIQALFSWLYTDNKNNCFTKISKNIMILCVSELCDKGRFQRYYTEVLTAHLLHYAKSLSQGEPCLT